MGERTKIAWCHSTMNPWIGCSEVGPGCDHCYAREVEKGQKWGGSAHWGPGIQRYRTSAATWAAPLKWNKVREIGCGQYALLKGPKPEPHRVFCASLADIFDNEVPIEWHNDLARLIHATPYLSWLLVTRLARTASAGRRCASASRMN